MAIQSKTVRRNKALRDRRLIYENVKEYNHLISIGFTKEQAIKRLRQQDKSSGGIEKIKKRISLSKSQFGVTGVNLKGIRITKDVLTYIKKIETAGVIESYVKGHDTLRLKKPRIWTPL